MKIVLGIVLFFVVGIIEFLAIRYDGLFDDEYTFQWKGVGFKFHSLIGYRKYVLFGFDLDKFELTLMNVTFKRAKVDDTENECSDCNMNYCRENGCLEKKKPSNKEQIVKNYKMKI